MCRLYLYLLFLLMFDSIYAQNKNHTTSFHPPVDIPIHLSGNFAELRSDHFHSGIDIRTQGISGKKVYSIDEGYVSRIKIQTNGYGKSVYINHPGGYTSVYGHLSSYSGKIDEYVKNYQYKNQTHTLDLYPAKNEIAVKKGEIIALSGNTGSSAGPHLHFEIRNSANQHPLNVLDFGFDIKDSRPPEIYGLYLYSFSGQGARRTVAGRKELYITHTGNMYRLQSDRPVEINQPVSFGIEAYDFLDANRNRCGLYTIEVFINDEIFYSFRTDEFSFAESRFINSHTDYALRHLEDKRVHDLFRRPNNSLSMVKFEKNDGILNPLPGKEYQVKILLSDVYGNKSQLDFTLTGNLSGEHLAEKDTGPDKLFQWDSDNEINNHVFKFFLPSKSLYEDTQVRYTRIEGGTDIHAYEHDLGDPSVPMHRAGRIMLKLENGNTDPEKVCIVRRDEEGKWVSEGGEADTENWISANIREFGTFSLEVDTIPPEIQVVNLIRDADLRSARNIRFIVQDELSGISSYRGYIDNQWVLFEYDPKNDLVYYEFDKNRLKSGQKHELELYITDERENTSVFHSMFFW